jgi:hypothetical protein
VKKFRLFLLLFILVQLLLPAQAVFADTGPKPTMEFEFKQGLPDGEVTIVSGILYECNQPDCVDAAPLEELGPQGLYCEATSCRALGYGFAPYHILEIEFSDGVTRRSNIFETAGFASKYTVTIQPDDLLVKAQFSLSAISPGILFFLVCACACNGIALVTGLIIFLIMRAVKK